VPQPQCNSPAKCTIYSLLRNGSVSKYTQTCKTFWKRHFLRFPCVNDGDFVVFLCVPLPLQGNGLAKNFPRQRRVLGDGFYAICVVPEETRRAVLPRTCFNFGLRFFWNARPEVEHWAAWHWGSANEERCQADDSALLSRRPLGAAALSGRGGGGESFEQQWVFRPQAART
jgi:hypothetical protein